MSALPVRFAGEDVFARARECFRAVGYHDRAVDEQMRREPRLMTAYMDGALVSGFDAAQTLTRFFFGGSAREEEMLGLLAEDAVADLRELGLLESAGDGLLRPTVRLRPMLGVYVITDLHARYAERQSDFVYPPDGPNTHEYLSHLPGSFQGEFLEACGGSGVAALVAASRGAQHASSLDISERCSQFARFSALLSGLTNFTAATGDAFAPAEGKRFDCIAMHPPYVPVLRNAFVFSDGGNDGEMITRRHIAAMPDHLKPGGRVYCRAMATDRKGKPLELRLREWLGERHGEFDIVVHTMRRIDPVRQLWERPSAGGIGDRTTEEVTLWLNMVEQLGIEQFVLCAFILQRHDGQREPFTLRREMGEMSTARHLSWLLDWQTLCAKDEAARIVLASPLRMNSCALTVRHGMVQGEWIGQTQTVDLAWPYALRREVDELVAYVLPRLDGRQTGREVFHQLIADGVLASSGEEAEHGFGAHLAELAGLGFLIVEGHAPPPPPAF